MKNIKNTKKTGFVKKIFIKFCRKLGYEIIDQNNFEIPTLDKKINDDLSTLGHNSINLPLGEIKITRKVRALDIIVRTCASVTMLTQNKTRLFEKEKIQYTLRTIHSLLNAVKLSGQLQNLNINFKIIDHNSTEQCLERIKNIFKNFNTKYTLINLDVEKFKNKINQINQRGEKVTFNQMSNMANIHQSLLEAKKSEDLIYFVEDDYIHQNDAIEEMIYSYEKLSTLYKKDVVLCPSDYPFLYSKLDQTNILTGYKKHWRTVNETLCTYLISHDILKKYWKNYEEMFLNNFDPYEKPLHKLYKKVDCFSPMPSIALHLTNVNSNYGLSPLVDWLDVWKKSRY